MHFILCIWVIFVVWHTGTWKEWTKYHSTMLFFGFMELQYNLIVGTSNHFLWKIVPDLFLTRVTLISLYVFVIFPMSALLFLSNYPESAKKQVVYITKWVFIYTFVEGIASLTNRIIYFNGWQLFDSFIFNFILFWGLRFHHKRPFTSYIFFILVSIAGVLAFKIPI